MNQLEQYLESTDYPPEGESMIKRNFHESPVRKTESSYGNVRTRYCSSLMGETRSTESNVETDYALLLEYDPDVIAYFAQPVRVKISYENENGGITSFSSNPDYFVLRTNSAGWVENKKHEKLKEKQDECPNRFIQNDKDWRIPSAEEFAEEYGLFFKLITNKNLNSTLISNLRYLDDY